MVKRGATGVTIGKEVGRGIFDGRMGGEITEFFFKTNETTKIQFFKLIK